MIAMRKKTADLPKARLVSRGVIVSHDRMAFSSASTTARGSVRAAIRTAQISRLVIGSIGATRALPQSDTVAFEDRQHIFAHGYIKLPRPEDLLYANGENSANR